MYRDYIFSSVPHYCPVGTRLPTNLREVFVIAFVSYGCVLLQHSLAVVFKMRLRQRGNFASWLNGWLRRYRTQNPYRPVVTNLFLPSEFPAVRGNCYGMLRLRMKRVGNLSRNEAPRISCVFMMAM